MIDLNYNHNKPEPNVHQQVAEALVEAFHNSGLASIAVATDAERCCLESPILKLVKERNEARELVKRMHAAVNVDAVGEEYYTAMLDAHRAIIGWKGGAK
jgi:hypothetical protein